MCRAFLLDRGRRPPRPPRRLPSQAAAWLAADSCSGLATVCHSGRLPCMGLSFSCRRHPNPGRRRVLAASRLAPTGGSHKAVAMALGPSAAGRACGGHSGDGQLASGRPPYPPGDARRRAGGRPSSPPPAAASAMGNRSRPSRGAANTRVSRHQWQPSRNPHAPQRRRAGPGARCRGGAHRPSSPPSLV